MESAACRPSLRLIHCQLFRSQKSVVSYVHTSLYYLRQLHRWRYKCAEHSKHAQSWSYTFTQLIVQWWIPSSFEMVPTLASLHLLAQPPSQYSSRAISVGWVYFQVANNPIQQLVCKRECACLECGHIIGRSWYRQCCWIVTIGHYMHLLKMVLAGTWSALTISTLP